MKNHVYMLHDAYMFLLGAGWGGGFGGGVITFLQSVHLGLDDVLHKMV